MLPPKGAKKETERESCLTMYWSGKIYMRTSHKNVERCFPDEGWDTTGLCSVFLHLAGEGPSSGHAWTKLGVQRGISPSGQSRLWSWIRIYALLRYKFSTYNCVSVNYLIFRMSVSMPVSQGIRSCAKLQGQPSWKTLFKSSVFLYLISDFAFLQNHLQGQWTNYIMSPAGLHLEVPTPRLLFLF